MIEPVSSDSSFYESLRFFIMNYYVEFTSFDDSSIGNFGT